MPGRSVGYSEALRFAQSIDFIKQQHKPKLIMLAVPNKVAYFCDMTKWTRAIQFAEIVAQDST